jgi:hypothetical protein
MFLKRNIVHVEYRHELRGRSKSNVAFLVVRVVDKRSFDQEAAAATTAALQRIPASFSQNDVGTNDKQLQKEKRCNIVLSCGDL